MGLFDRLLGRAEARPLASGTRSRADGIGGRWYNATSGQGGSLDRHSHTEFPSPVPLNYPTIDAVLEFQAIGRRVVNREPGDATREGYALTHVPPELGAAVCEAADGNRDDGTPGLGVMNAVGDARRWARAYGGGAVLVLADDGLPAHEPINIPGLRRIVGLEALDRYEISVAELGLDPSDIRTFGKPVRYVVGSGSGLSGKYVHASRVVPFHGNRLPGRCRLRKNGWDGSVLDLIWSELRNYGTAHDYVTEAITLITQGVFKTEDLGAMVDAGDESAAAARFEAMREAMGLFGDIVVDKAREDYEVVTRTLSGLDGAAKTIVDALVAATDMPRSILLGETPGGLNSGENLGELQAWYGHVSSLQPRVYEPGLRRILALLMLSADGPTQGQLPRGWGVKWRDLWVMSELERADLELKQAQRRAIDVGQAGVVSRDEARRDPVVVSTYGIDPSAPAPAVAGEGPEGPVAPEDDLEPVPAADPSQAPPGEPLVGPGVVAEYLGVSKGSIAKRAARGDFPAFRVGGQWRYAMSLVRASVTPLRAVQ